MNFIKQVSKKSANGRIESGDISILIYEDWKSLRNICQMSKPGISSFEVIWNTLEEIIAIPFIDLNIGISSRLQTK